MNPIPHSHHALNLLPDMTRVILRPFLPATPAGAREIIERVTGMEDGPARHALDGILADFEHRHHDLQSVLHRHLDVARAFIGTEVEIPPDRQLLSGAYFTGEYAVESAALFNPSIVPHPDQSDLPDGALRFIMSLRATGEGHISSLEFRSGRIDATGEVTLDPTTRFLETPQVDANPRYPKSHFLRHLASSGLENIHAHGILDGLPPLFTRAELLARMNTLHPATGTTVPLVAQTLRALHWVAASNYQIHFPAEHPVCERILFPVSESERNGIEDARFVRFQDADGEVTYQATTSAYDGQRVWPQAIETRDFLHFTVRTLHGEAVRNKGMAYFPRRVGGRYAMLSRQDDVNLSIMFSDDPSDWQTSQVLLSPREPWESVKIGNCGSPLETKDGWLVLTHGVGPMRTYGIGAALLDLDDPTRVLGRLTEPLIRPEGEGREGYVPNVVYSCGSLIHRGRLILPYAMSDRSTSIVDYSVADVIGAMTKT